jgi:hypothetical protein
MIGDAHGSNAAEGIGARASAHQEIADHARAEAVGDQPTPEALLFRR